MRRLDELSTDELLAAFQAADAEAVEATRIARPQIARAVDALVDAWPAGGRLLYVGAGTSGRIGALDAAECGPTFGVPEGRVLAIIAGGDRALAHAVEGAEDAEDAGHAAVVEHGVGHADLFVGLSASGTTAFTCAALEEAATREATTVAVTCSAGSRLANAAAIPIVVPVGPEIVDGSTRMKAGTAQKLVCNAISTAAFIRLGRVWGRHMVAVKASNTKLRRRAEGILRELGGCDDDAAAAMLLDNARGDLRTALLMARAGLGVERARALLQRTHGDVHAALSLTREGS